MAETTISEVREQISAYLTDLEHLVKDLKKRSTLSFVERQSLAGRAGTSLTELREQETALDGKSDDDDSAAALIAAAQPVLARADKILVTAHGGSGQAGTRGPVKGGGGAQRRGVGAMSQQRAPNRSGSE